MGSPIEVESFLLSKWSLLIHTYSTDSSTYATFLFNAFDTNHDGSVSFEVSWRRWAREAWGFRARIYKTNLEKGLGEGYLKTHSPPPPPPSQDFVAGLSVILRGTIDDRLNWAFNLYDLNKDGCITKEVCRATEELEGRCKGPIAGKCDPHIHHQQGERSALGPRPLSLEAGGSEEGSSSFLA